MKPLDKKHSPGPWEATDYYYKTYVKNGSEVIAQLPGCGGEIRANADLISAAPELLECLKDAVADYGCYGCTVKGKPCLDKETFSCNQNETCQAKRWMEAIRKAEGLK